jgi:methionyl-tRNA synthetase
VATAGKKASKKRKTKKARKSPSASASKKAAAKKRAAKKSMTTSKRGVKKAGKASKKAAKKAPKKAAKKSAKKVAKKAVKKSAKKSATKTAPKKRAVTPQEASPAIQAAPVAESPKPAAPRSKPAPAAKPAAAAERDTYFITTAIAYPNGIPHIGHAYEAIATDALARFQRLNGKDVFFLTGTDEHGLKMVQTAESEGMSVAELAARNAGRFKEMDERLNVSFDRFIRTTEPEHHRSVQVVWNRMQQNGDIYIDTYAGWYSVRDEAY